jgi:hypothetical protein
MLATVWRIWILSRNVAKAEESATKARARSENTSHPAPNAVVYPIDISVRSLGATYPIRKITDQPETKDVFAKAVFVSNTPVANQLVQDVANHAISVAYISSEAYGLAAAKDYTVQNIDTVAAHREKDDDILIWAIPLDETAIKMPIASPSDAADARPTTGYFKAYVLGF